MKNDQYSMYTSLKILTRLKSLFPSRGKPLGVSGEHGGLADIIEAKIEHTDTLHPYVQTQKHYEYVQDECSALWGRSESKPTKLYG